MNDYDKLKDQYNDLFKEFKQLSRDYLLLFQTVRILQNRIKILTAKDLTNKQKKSLLIINGTDLGGEINATTN